MNAGGGPAARSENNATARMTRELKIENPATIRRMARPKSADVGSGTAPNVPTGNEVAEPLIAETMPPKAVELVLTIKNELDSPKLTSFAFPVNGTGG